MEATSVLPNDFWEPRQCFEPPPAETEAAVGLLDAAATLLIMGERSRAARMIELADMPVLFAYVERIWGAVDLNIHRYRDVPAAPVRIKGAKERMPNARIKREIHCRDGWRCRFCGIRVVAPAALGIMQKTIPEVARSGPRNVDNHAAFLVIKAVVDHLLPHSRGGDNDPGNLVTTCGPCNYGRSYWTIEEVGLIDPRLRPPVVDDWDGLVRLEALSGAA